MDGGTTTDQTPQSATAAISPSSGVGSGGSTTNLNDTTKNNVTSVSRGSSINLLRSTSKSLQRSMSEVVKRKKQVAAESGVGGGGAAGGSAGVAVEKGQSNSAQGSLGALSAVSRDDNASQLSSSRKPFRMDSMAGSKIYGDLSPEDLSLISSAALKRVNAIFKQHGIKALPHDTVKQVNVACGMVAAKKKWWAPSSWKKDQGAAGASSKDAKEQAVLKTLLCKSIEYASIPVEADNTFNLRRIPILAYECINYVKANGLRSNGVFRVNGSEKRMAALATVFDAGPKYGIGNTFEGNTVYDVADFLKKYVRGLPEPLLTTELYPHFLKCLDLPVEGAVRVKAIRYLLLMLPPPHLVLFECLLELLYQVSQHASENQMTVSNLARIFSPNVLRPKSEKQALEEFQSCSYVLEFMIENIDQFCVTSPWGVHPFEALDAGYVTLSPQAVAARNAASAAQVKKSNSVRIAATAPFGDKPSPLTINVQTPTPTGESLPPTSAQPSPAQPSPVPVPAS